MTERRNMQTSGIFYMNNCKLMQELYKKEIPAKQKQTVKVGEDCTIQFAVKEPFSMMYFEKIVCDAVYSIWQAERYRSMIEGKNRESVMITPTEILAWMTGKPNIRVNKVSRDGVARSERICELLERLGQTDIAIWWGEELRQRQILGVAPVLAGKFLPLVRDGKKERFQLSLKYGLPVYEYASAIHQMVRIPLTLLACGDRKQEDGSVIPGVTLRNTDAVIQLKHILLQRMELLRNPNNSFTNRKLRYEYDSHIVSGRKDGIFPLMGESGDCGTQASWLHRKQNLHKQVCTILDYYVRIGYLTEYTDAGKKEGNKRRSGIVGVDLTGEIRNPDIFR